MEEVENFYFCQHSLPLSIRQGELQTAWRSQVGLLTCALTLLLCFSAKLGGHDVVHWGSASCYPHISVPESQPRTFTTLTPSRVPMDVEQALFSVTDVGFAVQNPHFPSISNGQVSVCTALECPFQGTSDRQRQKSPSPAQRTSYDIAERLRKYYNFLSTRKKSWGLWSRSARQDQTAEIPARPDTLASGYSQAQSLPSHLRLTTVCSVH